MPIGISEEHESLRATARRFLEARCPPDVPRAYLEAEQEELPPFWDELAAQGWLGLAVDERYGGQGYGLVEVAVVLEELGRAMAPGPFLPTVLAAAVIAETGTEAQKAEWLPRLVDGSTPAAVTLADGLVLGGGVARALVTPGPGGCDVTADPRLTPASSLDPTRRLARVDGKTSRSPDRVRDLAAVLFCAEAVGVAGWCLDTASSYAKVREQFGRPIGQFQAVKHKCSNMLVAVEQARAVVWDAVQAASDTAASPLPVAVAASIALDAAADCAKDCVQILGGIGFTWEHDAHLYLKRAMAVRQLAGSPSTWRNRVATLALAGTRRHLHIDLPPEAERVRAEVQAFVVDLKGRDRGEWNRRMADEGYLAPHWPRPWGRDAGPVEQLVIDQELAAARVRRPNLAVGAWALPTIIAHGTPEQQERFVGPTLLGDIWWCQMFSEPGAGSDLASLSTKAVRVDGGWSLSGQKVWTSMAQRADWAICLARTDPEAPKHAGITYFLVDMKSDGLDVRPLRELTGEAMFNEVFLSDVFVPDDCVVGAVDDGWRLARTTLANERVSMASGSSFGGGVENLLELLVARREVAADPVILDRVGALVAEAQSLALLGLRTALRAVSGVDPGPESSVRKLLGVEHEQRTQELGVVVLGPDGATTEGDAAGWNFGFLANRCLTIAGGTSEVQRNVIAERLLGLPRDA
ncbi:MAG: acyl-CoA dehydrogenase domain protein [Acidimicrobiales bacterium]|nr:acyl-CoA dehydrogenase domain protein [Acidimicrobiales bacterium]